MTRLEIEMDYEHNSMIYEVSFFYENCKYNYDIDAVTREITEAKSNPAENKEDAESNKENNKNSVSSDTDSSQGADSSKNADSIKKEEKKTSSTAEYIGEEKAREIVLLHAQLTVNEITDYKCEIYVQKDTPVYKIKFDANGYEYSCDINDLTGEIVKYDREPEGKRN